MGVIKEQIKQYHRDYYLRHRAKPKEMQIKNNPPRMGIKLLISPRIKKLSLDYITKRLYECSYQNGDCDSCPDLKLCVHLFTKGYEIEQGKLDDVEGFAAFIKEMDKKYSTRKRGKNDKGF